MVAMVTGTRINGTLYVHFLSCFYAELALFRRQVAGLSPRRLDTTCVHMEFVVGKVSPERVFSRSTWVLHYQLHSTIASYSLHSYATDAAVGIVVK